MAHTHNHAGDTGNIQTAFWLNLGFTILELIGGVFTNSIAIIADAVHDLGDSAALGLAWYLERLAGKSGDWNYSYGYRRFSLLGALINAGILVGGSLLVLTEAVPRLFQPEPANAPWMVVFALIGVTVNGLAVLRLRGSSGMNARVVGWHLLEDVLGWVAVLIVSIVLLFTDWYILDPLLSIGITAFILWNAVRNLRGVLRIFLQATPAHIDLAATDKRLRAIAGVESTHHTHIWSLDGEHNVLSTHLVVAPDTKKSAIVAIKDQTRALSRELDVVHITVEVEYADEECAMRDGDPCAENR